MNKRKAYWAVMLLVITSAFISWAVMSTRVTAQSTSQPPHSQGRFVAIIPPPAGEQTYANFLWVVDSSTGGVSAYRIASQQDAAGKHVAWITERLMSDVEYYQLQKALEGGDKH